MFRPLLGEKSINGSWASSQVLSLTDKLISTTLQMGLLTRFWNPLLRRLNFLSKMTIIHQLFHFWSSGNLPGEHAAHEPLQERACSAASQLWAGCLSPWKRFWWHGGLILMNCIWHQGRDYRRSSFGGSTQRPSGHVHPRKIRSWMIMNAPLRDVTF